MLQIATGMYFSTDDLYETRHRRALYSNGLRLQADDVALPFATLSFSSAHTSLSPLFIEVIDRLEKVNVDGSNSFLVATGGDELVQDAADLIAFALNLVVTPDVNLAQCLLQNRPESRLSDPARRLRRLFDPAVYITDGELAELSGLAAKLLQLRRPYFEAVMRAIRRIADATTMAAADVTLSYTLFVAALESLSVGTVVPPIRWEAYDANKRRLVEGACVGLPDDRQQRIQDAVLQIDQLSIRRRFRSFVLEHITPSFFREEAREALQPIRAVDLPRALDLAYRLRSSSVHEQRELAPELWMAVDREDSIWLDGRRALTLEGLNRLTRHVIRNYIMRAPVELDSSFKSKYRDALPGQVRVRLAPEMWVGKMDQLNASAGPVLFNALVDLAIRTQSGTSSFVDFSRPLARIERLVPAEAKSDRRVPLLATYYLWHAITPPAFHRPNARKLLDRNVDDLRTLSLFSYTLAILLDEELRWSDDEIADLLKEREAALQRGGKRTPELPTRVDAALQVGLALRLWRAGDHSKARTSLRKAVELLPGDSHLMELERVASADGNLSFDLVAFVRNVSNDETARGFVENPSVPNSEPG